MLRLVFARARLGGWCPRVPDPAQRPPLSRTHSEKFIFPSLPSPCLYPLAMAHRNQNNPPMRLAAFANAMNNARPGRIRQVLPPRAPGPVPPPPPVDRAAYGAPAPGPDMDAWVANNAQAHLHRLEKAGKDDADDPQVQLLTAMVEENKARVEFIAHKSVANANILREKLGDIIRALHAEREEGPMDAEELATNRNMEERARQQIVAVNATGY